MFYTNNIDTYVLLLTSVLTVYFRQRRQIHFHCGMNIETD